VASIIYQLILLDDNSIVFDFYFFSILRIIPNLQMIKSFQVDAYVEHLIISLLMHGLLHRPNEVRLYRIPYNVLNR